MKGLIKNMTIDTLSCSQDMSGEYTTDFHMNFFLVEPITIEIFGIVYIIDRVVYRDAWGEEEIMVFANDETEFEGFKITKKLFLSIYMWVLREEKNGILKKWCFADGLKESYRDIGTKFAPDYIV